MENKDQLNNTGQDIDLNVRDEAVYQKWINPEKYDVDALLGDEDHVNNDQEEDEEEHNLKVVEASKSGKKCFTAEQTHQELESSSFQQCAHQDEEMRNKLADNTGLEARHIKSCSLMKMQAVGDKNKDIQQQNDKLLAENMELKQRLLAMSCGRCHDPADEKRRLVTENARLNHTYLVAQGNLVKLIHDAKLPPNVTMEHLASASLNQMTFSYNGSTDSVILLAYTKRALQEFLMLALNREPTMWLPTINGNMLNEQEYKKQTFPGLLGPCPQGFVMEATKETSLVRTTASSLVMILTDMLLFSKMFPGIIEAVRASKVVSSGNSTTRDGLIQEMNVDLWVQSHRPPNRRVKFLRFTKQVGERTWAVVDVSIDGIRGIVPEGRRIGYTTCRLLPSGCLIQDLNNGYCKVTWIVHAEYNEAIVPPLFRQLFRSGQALGANRWLATLWRQCEYFTIQHASYIPSNSSSSEAALSALGRKRVLVMAQQMMACFYGFVSKPALNKPSNIVMEWRGRCGTAAEMFEATVRMVIRSFSAVGVPPAQVLSANMTVWLPNTPPRRVREYLLNGQRRGEWDTFANQGAVQELSSVTTCPLRGNAISILQPNDQNSNVLILQEATRDRSCSLVVYSSVEKSMMRAIMDGSDNTSVFIMPSGFAILPDGHGVKTPPAAAASSSSAPPGENYTAGSLLTASYQAMLPSCSASNSIHAAGILDDTGNRVCNAIKQILSGVGADIAKPA